MGTKCKIIKNCRSKEALRTVEQQEVAKLISQGEYQQEVRKFRRVYPLMTNSARSSDSTLNGY